MKKLLTLAVLFCTVASFACAQSPSNKARKITTAEFQEMLDGSDDPDRLLVGDKPMILDFSATWCGPCKQFAPIFDASSLKLGNKVHYFKVDIDEERDMAELFEIKVVPTLVFIPVSGEPTVVEGAASSQEELEEMITEVLL